MWIYLLRHGVAEDARPGLCDEERALTEDGKARLRRASQAWTRVVREPAVVISSPLLRARQTAETFIEAVGGGAELQISEDLVPSADPMRAITMLEGEMIARTASVALIGHEPHMGYLLGALMTGRQLAAVPLKKGMLVGLKAEGVTSLVADLRFALSQKTASKLT